MQNFILVPSLTVLLSFSANPFIRDTSPVYYNNTKAYAFDSSGKLVDSTEVDGAGNYNFSKLPPGSYNLTFRKSGYHDITVAGIEHLNSTISYHADLDFELDGSRTSFNLDTTSYLGTSDASFKEDISYRKAFAVKGYKSVELLKSPARGVSTRGTRSDGSAGRAVTAEATEYDGPGEGRVADALGSSMVKRDTRPTIGSEKPSVSVKAGQVTAGFWRDLDNWEKWKETNKDAGVAAHQNTWGFYPEQRFSVRFLDADGKPIIGKKVQLLDSRDVLHWEAITDNLGNAEFFANLNSQITTRDYRTFRVKISASERKFEFPIKAYEGSADIVNVPIKEVAKPIAEVAFVVDATGSMGDEIQYLQAELLDVITRVKKSNQCVDLRLASVFYKDNTDEYITKHSDFSNNPLDIVNFIYAQSAGGGGDFPEAVDAALEVTVDKLNWSPNAISKMMFLVLDAPPHADSASAEKMRKYTKIAASKGIKIIPITASGIDQSTEFLMKYMAIATNGNYIYITDHSGIGGAHAKPTGVKENVQYLNDLMVDIINQNTSWSGCKDSATTTPNPGIVEIITNGQWQVQFYPNPATDHIMVKYNKKPSIIEVYEASGRLVHTMNQPGEGKTRIEASNLLTGMYLIKCIDGENSITCRMLVMH